ARHVPHPLPGSRWDLVAAVAVAANVVIVALVAMGIITASNLVIVVICVTISAPIAYFAVILATREVTGVAREHVYAFIPLFIASTAFWSLYQQQFAVVTIYADERLSRDLFGWIMPITWVQSINPIFIILLSGVFAAVWTRWGPTQPS